MNSGMYPKQCKSMCTTDTHTCKMYVKAMTWFMEIPQYFVVSSEQLILQGSYSFTPGHLANNSS